MASSLHPTEGARLLLQRASVGEGQAAYDAHIYTPEAEFLYRAELETDGRAQLTLAGETAAPEELLTRLLNLARSTARAAGRKLGDGMPPWPERVLRWRGPGRG